jgi:hypothetical protein
MRLHWLKCAGFLLVGGDDMTCSYNGRSYSNGSLICANGRELKCDSGSWRETGYRCTPRVADKQISTLAIDLALLDPKATLEQQQALGLALLDALRKASDLESQSTGSTRVPFTESAESGGSGSSGGSGDGGRWDVATNDRGGVDANVTINIGAAEIGVGVSVDNRGNTDTNISVGGSWSW